MTGIKSIRYFDGFVQLELTSSADITLTAEEAFDLAAQLQYVATRAMIADAAVPLYED